MGKKQRQVVTASTFVPDNAYDETPPDFAALLRESGVAVPQTVEQQQATAEKEQKIDAMYPFEANVHVPLDKIIPAPEGWNFFPSQSPELLAELMNNILAYDQIAPARVWKQLNGTYIILGGHNRYRALCELHKLHEESPKDFPKNFTTMWCSVYDYETLDEVEARKIVIYDNTIRRENTKALQARSIINMNQLMMDTRPNHRPGIKRERIVDQIAETLGISSRKIIGINRLKNLIPEFWPLMDEKDKDKKVSNGFAQVVAGLDEELQHYIYNNGLWIGAKLSALQTKLLNKAQSVEDIQSVFSAPTTYTATTKVEISEPIPKDYESFMVAGTHSEIAILKSVLRRVIREEQGISELTKKLNEMILEKEIE